MPPPRYCEPAEWRRAAVFAGGYWLIAAAPTILALPFSYIVVSPRLQIFPSPAAAVLWAAVICQLGQSVARLRARGSPAGGERCAAPLIQVGLAALLLLPPAAHVARSGRLYAYSLTPIRVLSDAARAHPAERQLVVNAPNWIAPAEPDYALGHEGVEIMPAYVTPQLLAWTNTGIRAPLEGVSFPNTFPLLDGLYFDAWGKPQDWESMAQLVPEYNRVWMWEYGDREAALREAGAAAPGGLAPPQTFIASFEGRVWLVAARVAAGWRRGAP